MPIIHSRVVSVARVRNAMPGSTWGGRGTQAVASTRGIRPNGALITTSTNPHSQGVNAAEVSRTAADALWHVADGGTREAMSMWGALTSQRAITAAHLGDAQAAYEFLDRARPVAGRVGPGRNDFNTEFGPANLALYEIAVAVELGDAGRALRAAATVDASALSAERRARMLIDVARAHAQRRQVSGAVAALVEAEQLTPEQVHAHALVRQVVTDLLAMQNPPGAELAALSVRVNAP